MSTMPEEKKAFSPMTALSLVHLHLPLPIEGCQRFRVHKRRIANLDVVCSQENVLMLEQQKTPACQS